MRSTHPERPSGLTSALGSIGLAVIVAVLVVLLSPDTAGDGTNPPARTITLDELRAQLSDAVGDTPPTVIVETPDGPVTVVVPPTTTTSPTTSTRPPTTTTSTAPATTTTRPVPRDPDIVQDSILEQIVGLVVPTTTPEVVGDAE